MISLEFLSTIASSRKGGGNGTKIGQVHLEKGSAAKLDVVYSRRREGKIEAQLIRILMEYLRSTGLIRSFLHHHAFLRLFSFRMISDTLKVSGCKSNTGSRPGRRG